MKRLSIVSMMLVLPALLAMTTPSDAKVSGVRSGYCYQGTCNKFGGKFSGNVKYCKKEYCPAGFNDAAR